MADKKEGFWSFLTSPIKNMTDYVIKGVSNKIAGKDWSDENLKFGTITDYRWNRFQTQAPNQPTLNQIAIDTAQNSGPFVQNPDLTSPQNNLGTNSIWWQTDIDLTSWPTLSEVAQNSGTYSHNSILENLDISARDKVEANEKLINNEKEWNRFQRVGKFFSNTRKSWRDSATDLLSSRLIDMERQKAEKYAAVGYNEDNWNIIRLAINEGQWMTDDFHDTLFSVWEWNSKIFDQLYSEYAQNNEMIQSSWLDDYTAAVLMQENKENFFNEVKERNLLKLYADDYYSNQTGWFYPNMVAKNMLSWESFWDALDVRDRRKNQFTDEELKILANTWIKSTKDKWELDEGMFDTFLQAYEENNRFNEIADIWVSDTEKVRYTITEDALAEMRAWEAHQIYDWIWSQLTTLVDNWTISQDEANDILQNSYSWVADYLLDQMHLYMDPSLAYYAAVRNKNPWDMTDWERAILWYGPGMLKLMDDMTNAIWEYLKESIDKWIKDWKLSTSLEQINWMSITDFFKDAIKDSNIQAWGIDLSVRDSAVDAMQWINQNIAYLYWKDKGSRLRQTKTEAGKWLWVYWLIWWELAQDLTVGTLRIFWADKLADYTLADATKLMNLTTDTSALGSENFGRLLKKYWLAALENVPEFYWVYKSFSPLTRVGRAWGSYSMFQRINRMKNWVKKTRELQRYFNTIKKWVGTVWDAWWSKNWISKITSGMSNKLWPTGNAIMKKWMDAIKRSVADQTIDMMASYYDTENYSMPSYLLSVWLTWLFETFPALFVDTEALKILKNSLTPGRSALDGTWRKLMNTITSNEELMKRWTNIYWLDYDTFRKLAKGWAADSLDDVLRASYQALDEWWKAAVKTFSKEQAINQINSIMNIDWQSSYWRNLSRILNNSQTNWLDVWKYVLWIPWKIEYWGLQSSIMFKEWWETQTRYLLSEYDKKLDRITWQFRRKLENWFTENDIREIADITSGDVRIYKDVLDWGKVNWKYFVKDWNKYLLNSEWADYLWLKVSNYTDAMRKADVLKAQSKWVEKEINEMLWKLSSWRWISDDTVEALAQSGAYSKMVDTFSVFC